MPLATPTNRKTLDEYLHTIEDAQSILRRAYSEDYRANVMVLEQAIGKLQEALAASRQPYLKVCAYCNAAIFEAEPWMREGEPLHEACAKQYDASIERETKWKR